MKTGDVVTMAIVGLIVYLPLMAFFYRWVFRVDEMKKEIVSIRKDAEAIRAYLKLMAEKLNPEGLEAERTKREQLKSNS